MQSSVAANGANVLKCKVMGKCPPQQSNVMENKQAKDTVLFPCMFKTHVAKQETKLLKKYIFTIKCCNDEIQY